MTGEQHAAGMVLLRAHRAAIASIRDHFITGSARWQILNQRLEQADADLTRHQQSRSPAQCPNLK